MKLKEKLSLENLMCLFVILCPVLDIISFLFRNYFGTTNSPTTILRPIIPILVFVILFFKEKNKGKKIIIGLIYLVYSIIHLLIFQKLHNGSSYGNIANEAQYLINYGIMIINLYLFYKVVKDKGKIKKSVLISIAIYVISLFFSIITKTSSPTYLEGIGYKGYFESGNSLCTVLLLGLCIIFSNLELRDWKKLVLIIFTGIYLTMLSGMRTGLFGFGIIVAVFIVGKFFINIRDKVKFSKKQIIVISTVVIIAIIMITVLGSQTIERRKQLKQNEENNIDEKTGEIRFVTGDVLNIYQKIQNGEIDENYMSEAEKRAIVKFCEYAKNIKLSNVNLRKQQLIYNIILVVEQRNPFLILFGNGYKNQTGELVMEMEIPAFVCNFGIIGFILYFGPFAVIIGGTIWKTWKNRKEIQIDAVMNLFGMLLAVGLACFSGYVFFNLSSMTMVIILCTSGTIGVGSFWSHNDPLPTERKKMKKIVFGITSLGIGGAERVLVDIVNKLQNEYDITIFTLYGKGAFEKELSKNVKLISLYNHTYEEIGKIKKKIIPIKVLISGKSIYKKYIQGKFDAEIAFLEGPITRLFKYGKSKNKIVWVHNDIAKVFGDNFKARLKLKVDKKIYSKYDKIVFVSKDNKNSFNMIYNDVPNLTEKEQVIYNYIDKDRIIEKSKAQIGQEYIDKNVPSIITVARLVEQKAIDRLINVHKRLIDDGVMHNIYVIGDGPEKEKLQNLIKELKVEDTFKLMGKRENPYPYIKRADYFALLSKFEGYGMVIDEAKILNKKIIITDTAAKEAVKGYSPKLILQNTEEAIYEGLKQVIQKNVIFDENEDGFDNEFLLNDIRTLL